MEDNKKKWTKGKKVRIMFCNNIVLETLGWGALGSGSLITIWLFSL